MHIGTNNVTKKMTKDYISNNYDIKKIRIFEYHLVC